MALKVEVKNLRVNYGFVQAIRGINFSVAPGEAVGLIGSNGAGKSTFLKALMGLLSPQSGEIFFNSQSLLGTPAHQRLLKGMALVPEGRKVFGSMSVIDNLLVGAHTQFRFASGMRGQVEASVAELFKIFPILAEKKNVLGSFLSGGEQQMLAIARALISRPTLLLLDEPSMGLAPKIVETVQESLTQYRRNFGISIVVVEQVANRALKIVDRAYVLEQGQVVSEGKAEDLLKSRDFEKAYI